MKGLGYFNNYLSDIVVFWNVESYFNLGARYNTFNNVVLENAETAESLYMYLQVSDTDNNNNNNTRFQVDTIITNFIY